MALIVIIEILMMPAVVVIDAREWWRGNRKTKILKLYALLVSFTALVAAITT